MMLNRFARFTWGVLLYILAVILWGAFVRATGSGAGCGSHWPLCNGEVIPRAPQVETMIELTHRLTSGVALLLVVAMVVWAFRVYPRQHRVRRGATWSLVFIIVEALLGAGLVIFELVAHNASATRAFSMAAHLANTFILLAALSLTAWWASGGRALRWRGQGLLGWFFGIGFVSMLLIGMSGAITALGDTLLQTGVLSAAQSNHFLVQLRVFHPFISIACGIFLLYLAFYAARTRPGPAVLPLAQLMGVLFVVQLGVGAINVVLQAPVWLQLLHLLLADLIWIAMVLLAAAAFAVPQLAETPAVEPAARGVQTA